MHCMLVLHLCVFMSASSILISIFSILITIFSISIDILYQSQFYIVIFVSVWFFMCLYPLLDVFIVSMFGALMKILLFIK